MESSHSIRTAIAGIGNCASALFQGIHYYGNNEKNTSLHGLMTPRIGDWGCGDIEIVAAFDVDRRKVGFPLGQAIFAKPNCAKQFCEDVPSGGAVVMMGPLLDGIAPHMEQHPEDCAFRPSKDNPVDVARILKAERVNVLVSYMPVGADQATQYYAEACLEAGCAFVNCTPSFIASNPSWAAKFQKACLPIIGDDIKSQVGATIVHRNLVRLFSDRGVLLQQTYQLNVGGNTDFLNMLSRERLVSKKISKTNAVRSQVDDPLDDSHISIGPSDYVPWQKDKKVAFIRLEGVGFGEAPIEIEIRLAVQDSPNSAGIVIDAIRYAALARIRGLSGPIEEVSAWLMKSPPKQMTDAQALLAVEAFLRS